MNASTQNALMDIWLGTVGRKRKPKHTSKSDALAVVFGRFGLKNTGRGDGNE